MNVMLKQLGMFFLECAKAMDWKSLIYKTYMDTVLPILEKKSNDSASKLDNVIVAGITQFVIKFFSPDEPAIAVQSGTHK